MRTRHPLGIAALSLALSLVLAAGLPAQETPLQFDATGGLGLPAGDLADVADAGPAFGVAFGVGLTENFFLRLRGGAELYDGVDLGGPTGNEGINDLDLHLIHFQAGGLYYLLPRDRNDSPVSLAVEGAVGATNLDVPRVATSVGTDALEIEISELYLSTALGVSLGFAVHDQVDLFLEGRGHVVFGDEDDTSDMIQAVDDVLDEPVGSLDTMWSVPVTAGVRLHF